MGKSIEREFQEIFDQDKSFVTLARLLSLLEKKGPQLLKKAEGLLKPSSQSFRFGVTGPPGAGKSTLIGQLITQLRKKGFSVGVLAVDPSSPFHHGAILGDRIRYSDHFVDENVFIRSLGTRGSLGGLSASAYLMLRAFDWYGFDIVLIETVGVGQTELEIMNVADAIAVVLVPESGDSIQAMKAGLLEITDLYLINKADRPGADSLVRELEAVYPQATVLKTVATQSKGLDQLVDLLEQRRQESINHNETWKLKKEATALLRFECEKDIFKKVKKIQSVEDFKELF
ncbi:MAG: methylmalonyl Co-A mutase-associated GTPase MeaB [Bdellovibrio sp.]|nr:MAG: methylmalonyl Co-A mutase-associated GTPase MeaB [Bdellovibrio sp.]